MRRVIDELAVTLHREALAFEQSADRVHERGDLHRQRGALQRFARQHAATRHRGGRFMDRMHQGAQHQRNDDHQHRQQYQHGYERGCRRSLRLVVARIDRLRDLDMTAARDFRVDTVGFIGKVAL